MLPIKPNNPFCNLRFRNTWQNLIGKVAKLWRDFVIMQKVTIWSIQYLVHFVHSLHKAMDSTSKKASVTRDMPVVFRVDRWDCQEQMLCDRDSFAWLEFLNQSHFRFKTKNSSNYNLIPLFTVLLIIIFFLFNFVVGGVGWPLHALRSVLRSLSTTWTGWFKHYFYDSSRRIVETTQR